MNLLNARGLAAHKVFAGSLSFLSWFGLSVANAAEAIDQAKPEVVAASSVDADANPQTASIEEVVVTARLRKENSQDVPIALHAVSGETLRRDNTDVLAALAQKAPSLTVVSTNPRQASLAIRGIGLTSSNDGQDASTGIFVDGVYLARPGMAAFDFEDIAQVEVLRGPQGTLFGRNTSTGAVLFTTAEPKFDREGSVEASLGDYGFRQVKGYVTGSVNSKLAIRASGWWTERDGYINNVTNGQQQGQRGNYGGRLELLFKPNDDFRYRLIASLEYQNYRGVNSVITGTTNKPAGALDIYGRLNIAQPGYRPPSNPYDFESDNNNCYNNVGRKYTVTGIGDWTLANDYTLTSITNYSYWFYWPYNDIDLTKLRGQDQFGSPNRTNQWSQEFRIASPQGRPVEWVAGAIYFRSVVGWDLGQRWGSDAGIFSSALSGVNLAKLAPANQNFLTLSNAIGAALNGYAVNQLAAPATDSGGFFGQGTWHIDPKWSITAGARLSYDYRRVNLVQGNTSVSGDFGSLSTRGQNPLTLAQWTSLYQSLFSNPADATALFNSVRIIPANQAHASTSLWNSSGLFSVSYKPTQDILTYATYSHGYKSAAVNTSIVQPVGGISFPQVAKPEMIDNYEIGFKTTLLNGKLDFNGDLFWEDYRGYQANITVYIPNNPVGVSYLGNIANIVSRGVEIDVAAHPIEGLTIDASGSFNETYYKSFRNGPRSLAQIVGGQNTPNDLTGATVPYAPKWISNVTVAYEHPVVAGIDGYAVTTYSYRSGSFVATDFANNPETWQTGYGVTNLRIGARFNNRLDVSLWSENLFDTHYAVQKAVNTLLYYKTTTPGAPRTVGLTARFSF